MELDCILCSSCSTSLSVKFEADSFVMVIKIFSASGRLLAFLILFIAVVIWFSKLSITNKIKQILPPATNTSTPFKVAQGGFFLYGKSNLLKKKDTYH